MSGVVCECLFGARCVRKKSVSLGGSEGEWRCVRLGRWTWDPPKRPMGPCTAHCCLPFTCPSLALGPHSCCRRHCDEYRVASPRRVRAAGHPPWPPALATRRGKWTRTAGAPPAPKLKSCKHQILSPTAQAPGTAARPRPPLGGHAATSRPLLPCPLPRTTKKVSTRGVPLRSRGRGVRNGRIRRERPARGRCPRPAFLRERGQLRWRRDAGPTVS